MNSNLALALLVLSSSPAAAISTTQMQDFCLKEAKLTSGASAEDLAKKDQADLAIDFTDAGYCIGFLDGVSTTLRDTTRNTICTDKVVSKRELWKIFVGYVVDHRELGQDDANRTAMKAFMAAFPCSAP